MKRTMTHGPFSASDETSVADKKFNADLETIMMSRQLSGIVDKSNIIDQLTNDKQLGDRIACNLTLTNNSEHEGSLLLFSRDSGFIKLKILFKTKQSKLFVAFIENKPKKACFVANNETLKTMNIDSKTLFDEKLEQTTEGITCEFAFVEL